MKKYYFLSILAFFAQEAAALEIKSLQLSSQSDQSEYQEFIINGSGFGVGPNIVMYDDLDNQTAGLPINLDKALIGKWSRSSSYTEIPIIVNHEDGKAMAVRSPLKSGISSIAQIEAVFPAEKKGIFISYSVTVPEGKFFSGASEDNKFPDVSSWKFTWITDTPMGITSTTQFNICTPTHAGKGTFYLAGNSVNHGYVGVAGAWSWHTKNYMGFGLQAYDSANGKIYFQLSGKKDHALVFEKNTRVFPESNTTSFDTVKFPGWFGNGDQTNFNAYYDDLYVATGENAFARIEVSNGPSLQDSTMNLTLPVFLWTDEKIVAKISKKLLKNDLLYFRVYDKNNRFGTIKVCPRCPLEPKPVP